MFNLNPWKTFTYVLVIVLAGLLSWQMVGVIKNKNEKIQVLQGDKQGLEQKVERKQAVIEDQKQAQALTQEKQEVLQKGLDEAAGGQSAIQKEVRAKISQIEKKYEGVDKTPLQERLKNDELSLERTRGLFRSYCIESPKAAECVDKK